MRRLFKCLWALMIVCLCVVLYVQPVTAETTVRTERSYNKPKVERDKKDLRKDNNQAQTETEKTKKQEEEPVKNKPAIDEPNKSSDTIKSDSSATNKDKEDKNIEPQNAKEEIGDTSQTVATTSSSSTGKVDTKKEDMKTVAVSGKANDVPNPTKEEVNNNDAVKTEPYRNNQDISNVSPGRLPLPMSYKQALLYQSKHKNDIIITTEGTKDSLGNKAKAIFFDFMGKGGFVNAGNSLVAADYTALRLYISFGYDTNITAPTPYLSWGANMDGAPRAGFAPTGINVIFSDGYVKHLNLQGYTYSMQFYEGIFWNYSWSHYYYGDIKLNNEDIYEMTHHGDVAACHLTTGYNAVRHMFYSGEKNIEHKQAMSRGLRHIAAIMDINSDTISNERVYKADSAENARKQSLHDEIKAGILKEQEREKMREEIMEELRQEGKIQ